MDREKVIEGLENLRETIRTATQYTFTSGGICAMSMKRIDNALAMLQEQQQQIWELQDQVEYLTDKLKEHEVVRCKDCNHGGCRTNNLDGSIYRVVCKKHSTKRNERWMDADWFCADGERR